MSFLKDIARAVETCESKIAAVLFDGSKNAPQRLQPPARHCVLTGNPPRSGRLFKEADSERIDRPTQ